MIQNEEFIQEFVEEAVVHAALVEQMLLGKQLLQAGHESIHEVFRAVHSIKGTAGFFGLKKIVALSHVMENVFGEVRNERIVLEEAHIDVLLAANDCLKAMIDDVLNSESTEIRAYEEQLSLILGVPLTVETDTEAEIVAGPSNDERWLELDTVRAALQHGQKLYRWTVDAQTAVPLTHIETVANVLGATYDGVLISTADEATQWFESLQENSTDYQFTWVLASILESDLLHVALQLPADTLQTLSIHSQQSHAPSTATAQHDATTEQTTGTSPTSSARQAGTSVEAEVRTVRAEDSIRVHVSILNDLLNMASEMVLGRNQLLRTLEDYRKSIPGLGPILQNIDRLTSGMQEKVMYTRMQPLGNVFNKFPRMIRDLAKGLQKEMELVIEGEQVELDKSMIEALADPLTHLIRNAADHGLETPERRVAAGKRRSGTITLKAYHEGGYVYIDIIDDGAGMDSEKIKQKALEKQIISVDEVQRLSEQEALKLIFRPGFSTADQVTDLSGRGVGMDVVRTNIEKLGGSIELFSTLGEGSTVRLMLPLTLAIIQSLIVEAGGHKFALPQANLKEVVTVCEDQRKEERRIETIQGAEVLRLRGRLLPVVRLARILDIEAAIEPAKLRVLVLKIGSRTFGIIVDDIHGSEETLVKSLPDYLKDCHCYSGVTIMGDGKTSLILDLEGILRLSELQFREDAETGEDRQVELAELALESQNLLLFQCSGSEMFALDLSMVARVEEIEATQIERVGQREYIQFRGDSLRVIRPESYLDVTQENQHPRKLYVIIPKLVQHPIGIVIHQIYDNITTRVSLNSEDVRLKGIVGSTIYNDKLVLILNIYELFELAAPEFYAVPSQHARGTGKVLLAEDTPFFQKMEKSYLEEAGYEVTVVANGLEALAALEQQMFDIVVSDIQMPHMDGYQLVKRIREDKRWSHLPVIAVTSMTGERQTQQGMDSGFDFYEAKLDRDRLLYTMDEAIRLRKQVVTVD